ncbi:hypothetical protein ABK040_010328 [Willaertia magna]
MNTASTNNSSGKKKQRRQRKGNKKQHFLDKVQNKPAIKLVDPLEGDISKTIVQLTKDCAATDDSIRFSALEKLPSVLKTLNFHERDLETNFIDFRKLWKGVLYGFWLCDGVFKQHEMAKLMSELIFSIVNLNVENPEELPISFLRAFYDELYEVWSRLDKHRMDKYLMLIRKVTQQNFVFLNKYLHYSTDAVEEYLTHILKEGIFDNFERISFSTIQIHIIEMFLLEIVRYGGPQEDNDEDYHLNEDVLMEFISFFIEHFAKTIHSGVIKSYKEDLFNLLLQYEEPTAFSGDEVLELDEEELPLDEFGNPIKITKDRPLPIKFKRIADEFKKYTEGFQNSDLCKEYTARFSDRVNTVDDIYAELEELQEKNEEKKRKKKKKNNNKAESGILLKKQQDEEKRKLEEQKRKEEEERKAKELEELKKQKEAEKLNRLKDMVLKLKKEKQSKKSKRVQFILEQNQVKTFEKKDIVPKVPLDLTNSPSRGLLKRKSYVGKENSSELKKKK